MMYQSSAAVGPLLNAIINCQQISSVFSTVTLIVSQNFYQKIVLISENHPYFRCHRKTNVIIASWLTEYCHTGNFDFSVLTLKYLNLKNYSVNCAQNCKIYFKER